MKYNIKLDDDELEVIDSLFDAIEGEWGELYDKEIKLRKRFNKLKKGK